MTEQTKPAYSTGNNVVYLLKKMWKWDKRNIIYAGLRIPSIVMIPFLGTVLSSTVFSLVASGASVGRVAGVIAAFTAALLIFTCIDRAVSAREESLKTANRLHLQYELNEKKIRMDFSMAEDPKIQEMQSRAGLFISNRFSSGQTVFSTLLSIASAIAGLLLSGSILTALHPGILILLAALSVIYGIILRRAYVYQHQKWYEQAPMYGRMFFIYEDSSNFAAGKDIRLYGLRGWVIDTFERVFDTTMEIVRRINRRNSMAGAAGDFLAFIRDGAAYAVLITQALTGRIDAASFILYFGMVASFSHWTSVIATELNNLGQTSLDCRNFREFLDLRDESNTGEGLPLPHADDLPCEIVFENVSFRYPSATHDTLSDIDARIRPGEKIAVVGVNGAGKTTLMKMLCGLYYPTGGRILINGTDARSFNREEYFDLFTAVFQDINFLPATIAENIALREPDEIDYERVESCLRLAGIWERIESLEKGVHSKLIKDIHEDAVDFSGGEKQKLVLARALYKDAPVLMLDEPTAALDPIAESELYERYGELTRGRTSFFISHRLSSTRFCDRIIFLSDGRIAEMGTHDELMAQGGGYARMYEIQSHYYKKQTDKEKLYESAF